MYRLLAKKSGVITALCCFFVGFSLLTLNNQQAAAQTIELNLPTLGNTGANLYSEEQKRQLGQAWLMSFRAQVRTVNDPIIFNYLENLIYLLAQHSQLSDRHLELVVVSNKSLNAFAVPGGIVGVHIGIFLTAKNEAQLASILSHELAHLSQEHFERGREAQQRASIPTMAGMLAGLVLAATAGGDAGIAAITATQAAGLQNSLRFSRQNEQEADRIGMETMYESGFDPRQSSAMFQQMQRGSRYSGSHAPEFLLTHPLTESRIADAKLRSERYPKGGLINEIDYSVVQARVRIYFEESPQSAIKFFKANSKNTEGFEKEASQYGLAIAQSDAGLFDQASETLQPLIEKRPNYIPYQLVRTNILAARGQTLEAKKELENLLAISPNNYPLMQAYALLLQRMDELSASRDVWKALSELHPRQPSIWFELAEIEGLNGNIMAVHLARAEYFLLSGNPDAATRHLRYALKLAEGNYLQTEIIEQRLRDIQSWKQQLNLT